MKILVTGANGQLGVALQDWASVYKDMEFTFKSRKELDITDSYSLDTHFTLKNYDAVINTAAYTNVDGAETSRDLAKLVNGKALLGLSNACNYIGATLVHISTDYVFPGNSCQAYTEEDSPRPINYYGETKLMGEEAIRAVAKSGVIIRTSWLFDRQGNNFVRKILKLANEKHQNGDKTPLKVVADQFGAPTYACDLAQFILLRLKNNEFKGRAGVYNYTNTGVASWYDLAVAAIRCFNDNQVGFVRKQINCDVIPVKTEEFPTVAQRPKFSLLALDKIRKEFGNVPQHWLAAVSDATQFHSLID
jgi:dTDP-4-dehydrorhamnose reductase